VSRNLGPGLLAVLVACARTQQPAPAAQPSGPELDALRDAALRDLRCPDKLPVIKPSKPRPDAIAAVALAGPTAYGLSDAGRLWSWDGTKSARVFAPAPFVALARDGSVAVTHLPEDKEGARLEARRLPANQPVDHLVLPDGGIPIAVSASAALLRVGLPKIRCKGDDTDEFPCQGDFAWQPPTSELARWAFPSGATEREALEDCRRAILGAGGRSFACLNRGEDALSWENRDAPDRSYSVTPAPEWTPPTDPHNESLPLHWQAEEHWLQILSLRLGPSDDAIYVTYRAINHYIAERGLAGHRGWRLERWTPDPARPQEGRFSRLAESPDSLCTSVLAASSDGSLVVLGGRSHALTVRRAPRYAPEPLAVAQAVDAVVSADGTRILTGHVDGRLRLWDARSLALLSTSDGDVPVTD
jgi:hypothetical protein